MTSSRLGKKNSGENGRWHDMFGWERLRPWFSVGLLIVTVFTPVGLFIWLMFGTNMFTIQAITVLDAQPQTVTDIRSIIEQEIKANQTPRLANTIFTVNPDAIEYRVIQEVPRVRAVYITRHLPGTIKVVVQEKTPALLLLSQTTYYFVDGEGMAYEEARLDNLPGIVLPIVKNTSPHGGLSLGTPVVSQEFVIFVREMYNKLPHLLPAKIVELHIPSLAAREVRVRLSNNWEIRFDATRDVNEQLQVLRQLLEKTIPPEEQAVLEYIDLRIPNRVYYRSRS